MSVTPFIFIFFNFKYKNYSILYAKVISYGAYEVFEMALIFFSKNVVKMRTMVTVHRLKSEFDPFFLAVFGFFFFYGILILLRPFPLIVLIILKSITNYSSFGNLVLCDLKALNI